MHNSYLPRVLITFTFPLLATFFVSRRSLAERSLVCSSEAGWLEETGNIWTWQLSPYALALVLCLWGSPPTLTFVHYPMIPSTSFCFGYLHEGLADGGRRRRKKQIKTNPHKPQTHHLQPTPPTPPTHQNKKHKKPTPKTKTTTTPQPQTPPTPSPQKQKKKKKNPKHNHNPPPNKNTPKKQPQKKKTTKNNTCPCGIELVSTLDAPFFFLATSAPFRPLFSLVHRPSSFSFSRWPLEETSPHFFLYVQTGVSTGCPTCHLLVMMLSFFPRT